jgi:hypothetical protein
LAIFVSVALTVAVVIPVALAISDAVIGLRPFSAPRILALFWPRGARADAFVGSVGGLGGRCGRGRLGGGRGAAAETRHDRVLKIHHDLTQALELIDKPLMLTELILDLLQPHFDLPRRSLRTRTRRRAVRADECRLRERQQPAC